MMELSLAGWSLNALFRDAEDPLALVDFPAFAQKAFGIGAVELNNIYFESTEPRYVDQLNDAAREAGSRFLNIAVDERGDLASTREAERLATVDRYADWVPVAAELGCRAIRANSGGRDVRDREAAIAACVDSFRRLADVGLKHEVAILIENHGGLSGDAETIVRVVREVRRTHGEAAMATLVDFGNWPDEADRYASIEAIMPYAAAVHAKVNDIDADLVHPRFDHARCLAIARGAGYDGHLGIEYEGAGDPVEGVRRGARLLRRLIGG